MQLKSGDIRVIYKFTKNTTNFCLNLIDINSHFINCQSQAGGGKVGNDIIRLYRKSNTVKKRLFSRFLVFG